MCHEVCLNNNKINKICYNEHLIEILGDLPIYLKIIQLQQKKGKEKQRKR